MGSSFHMSLIVHSCFTTFRVPAGTTATSTCAPPTLWHTTRQLALRLWEFSEACCRGALSHAVGVLWSCEEAEEVEEEQQQPAEKGGAEEAVEAQ